MYMKTHNKKIWIALCSAFVGGLVLLYNACTTSNAFAKTDNQPCNIKALPFSGYICGFENTETFVQLPLLLLEDEKISAANIRSMQLIGEANQLECKDFAISPYTKSEKQGWNLCTLSFRVQLANNGEYKVNTLALQFSDGTQLRCKIGEIEFEVIENKAQIGNLSMRQFVVNQIEPLQYKISYANNTDEIVTIEDFTYPDDVCTGISITQYADFELKKHEDGYEIPPHETRTFVIKYDFDDRFTKTDGRLFYMLPFVKYSVKDEIFEMPAQTQATVVQELLSESFLNEFVN